MKADRIAHREFMRQIMARTDDNREWDREDLKMMVKTRTETDTIHERNTPMKLYK
jgi:type IV secretory pathway VirB4 component